MTLAYMTKSKPPGLVFKAHHGLSTADLSHSFQTPTLSHLPGLCPYCSPGPVWSHNQGMAFGIRPLDCNPDHYPVRAGWSLWTAVSFSIKGR